MLGAREGLENKTDMNAKSRANTLVPRDVLKAGMAYDSSEGKQQGSLSHTCAFCVPKTLRKGRHVPGCHSGALSTVVFSRPRGMASADLPREDELTLLMNPGNVHVARGEECLVGISRRCQLMSVFGHGGYLCGSCVVLQLSTVSKGNQGDNDLFPLIVFVGHRLPFPRIPLTRQVAGCPQSSAVSVGTKTSQMDHGTLR